MAQTSPIVEKENSDEEAATTTTKPPKPFFILGCKYCSDSQGVDATSTSTISPPETAPVVAEEWVESASSPAHTTAAAYTTISTINGVCPVGQWLCGDNSTCIFEAQKCDGQYDCPKGETTGGGEDEDECDGSGEKLEPQPVLEMPFLEDRDCFNCHGDCPPGFVSPSCLRCAFCLGRNGPDCRTCLENSLDIPGCRRCQTCPGSLSDLEALAFEESVEGGGRGALEDYEDYWGSGPSCITCFKIYFDHLGCHQCRSCPGGPSDTARFRKITKKGKNKKGKNKRRKKKESWGSKRERRQTDEEIQLPTITGGALGTNT